MTRKCRRTASLVGATAMLIAAGHTPGAALQQGDQPPALQQAPNPTQETRAGGVGKLLEVPITSLFPGSVPKPPEFAKPEEDFQAVVRGMTHFSAFGCAGCHAPNGGGGMGPALSNRNFIYGGSPGHIYLSIVQGRPRGMPSYGKTLPDTVIWDLAAYIRTISQEPSDSWGRTVSRTSPSIEQSPAGFQAIPDPWRYTQPFGRGSERR
jgi:cytochrome c oxidase cbb3-type subunit III